MKPGQKCRDAAGTPIAVPSVVRSTTRRQLLAGVGSFAATASVAVGGAAPATGSTAGSPATVVIAGPQGGAIDGWAQVLMPLLAHDLPRTPILRGEAAGGEDGVTGANRFETRAAPDGSIVLLFPGDAAIAVLAGDPRARYQAERWLPVITGLASGLVMVRPDRTVPTPGASLRIAAAAPTSSDLPALLGLELLGWRVQPSWGSTEPGAVAAFAAGHLDAIFLRGRAGPLRAAALMRAGARPLFSLGIADGGERFARDPDYPDVPSFPELVSAWRGGMPIGPLHQAWRATAVAASIEFALVLPALTSADLVAAWRHAGEQALLTPQLQARVAPGLRARIAPGRQTALSGMAAEAPALIELRRWLASSLGWHPA